MEGDILAEAARAPRGSVLATIVAVKGSVPRHPGSKMLVRSEGSSLGSVGGGRGELLALEAAARLSLRGGAALVEVEMLGEEVAGEAMICGGVNRILLECFEEEDEGKDSSRELYRLASELLAKGKASLLVKRLRGRGEDLSVELGLLDEDGLLLAGSAEGQDPAKAGAALKSGRPLFEEEGEEAWFYDPLMPREKLLIIGAGHVGLALAKAAKGLGFEIYLADQRPEFLLPERLPEGVKGLSGSFESTLAAFPFDAASYAVVVSPGHRFDLECVRALLPKEYRYLGFIGSARKVAMLLAAARAEGFPAEKIEGIFAPIGLDIEAETPEEIAISVLAEIIAVRRGAKSLGDMSLSRRPGSHRPAGLAGE